MILIVQRRWLVADKLRSAFEAVGARALVAKTARAALAVADQPELAAAVLDSQSDELWPILRRRGVPFLIYSARADLNDVSPRAPIIRKPARTEEVLAAVAGLLRSHDHEH
jgi:DNA-binding response OmpR family regulator